MPEVSVVEESLLFLDHDFVLLIVSERILVTLDFPMFSAEICMCSAHRPHLNFMFASLE
jgi:hypothetical protein